MESHEIKTAGEAMDTVNRLNSAVYKNQQDCKCDDCNEDQQCRGCGNRHKCVLMTKALLDNLMEKWDLWRPDQDDRLCLTQEDKLQNQAAWDANSVIRFNPEIDSENFLIEGIWMFISLHHHIDSI